MPGSTENTNILAAANQLIKAVNDLTTAIETGGTAAIADAITAQTVVIETRSIADTTALNTNFTNLIASVDNLDISTTVNVNTDSLLGVIENCCTNFQLKLDGVISAIKNIRLTTGPGGDMGGPFLDEPMADPPPPGDPATDNEYICAAANYIWQYMWDALNYISSLNNMRAEMVVYAVPILTATLDILALPMAPLITIIGLFVELLGMAQNWYIAKYFEDLANEFQANKDTLVCGLYTAAQDNSPTAAKAAIDAFIDASVDGVINIDYGLDLPAPFWGLFDAGLRSICKSLAGNYLLNNLFVCTAEVDAYSASNPGLDCSACGCTIRWDFDNDTEGWVSVIDSNDNTVVQSWSTNQALRTEITMLNTGNGATGKWEYIPADHNQEFIVSTGDVLETILNFIVAGANGAHLTIYFTDTSAIDNYIDVSSSPQEFSITIDAANTGKTIEKLTLDYHIGPGGDVGTATVGEWDYVQLTLAAGGC